MHGFDFLKSLDVFRLFYISKYADYHAHEIAFQNYNIVEVDQVDEIF